MLMKSAHCGNSDSKQAPKMLLGIPFGLHPCREQGHLLKNNVKNGLLSPQWKEEALMGLTPHVWVLSALRAPIQHQNALEGEGW